MSEPVLTVDEAERPWPYRESIPVRYQECDMQQVVFNAHYLSYCDLTMTAWMAAHGFELEVVDWMLVKVVIEWQGSATFHDVIDVDVGVARWGNTSFEVAFRGTVSRRPVFSATITYVSVAPGTTEKITMPDDVRAALGSAPI